MANIDLTSVFQKYAGAKIEMTESLHYVGAEGLALPCSFISLKDPHDPVIEAMKQTASQHNLQLHVHWAGGPGIGDSYRAANMPGHIIAHIKKENGVWQVSRDFKLG